MIWGVLPWRHILTPNDMRWSLGSYDICFKNNSKSFLTSFFNHGQVLPTHRLHHSPHGGLFQPTMAQCIRLLSSGPFLDPPPFNAPPTSTSQTLDTQSEPHSALTLPPHTYTTTGTDIFPSPPSYPSRRHSWIHIFPEGKVHQKDDKSMRYFKWGVARLILESEPCPDVVPMWIEGPDQVMHETRTTPRWWPRWGKDVRICFGEKLGEEVWRPFRERWRRIREHGSEMSGGKKRVRGREGFAVEEEYRDLHEKAEILTTGKEDQPLELGVLPDRLKHSPDAVRLRMDVAQAVREQVVKLRRRRGHSEEDPKARMWDTWIEEGGKTEGRMDDGSYTRDT